ncbi:histidine phosphatase family protein [Deinococcus deserti]|uniref:Putative phosphoglycerate mutase n=1 Tax=Deinococcus deserti (strain DSM 17065 / CIP 109153 / LMG 22923 / VCD115) TaxID=546414 RepID=C1D110_DEIDV|nr:histidine phosphatase family protein [Deinococcus deserti]ACO45534.1 putative phosphoglycerate mutase [Deinococcus deserti VCD115]
MERLFKVRHAETLGIGFKVLRGVQRRNDVLSEHGHQQAALCRTALTALRLSEPVIYASTFLRAQQTAGALAEALGVGVNILEGLQEIDTGDWYGRSYAELETHSHELFRQTGHFGFPGGESIDDVKRRARHALTQILSRGGPLVIVSHGLAIQILLCDLLGTDFAAAWADGRYAHANTAISELRRHEGQWLAVRLGCAHHLTGALA